MSVSVDDTGSHRNLKRLDATVGHRFLTPAKRIHEGEDVSFFLRSRAYTDIMTFLFQLNTSMFPRMHDPNQPSKGARMWQIGDPDLEYSLTVKHLRQLIESLAGYMDEAPPNPGPRRFGNVSFRIWYQLVESRISGLLEAHLPSTVVHFGRQSDDDLSPLDEITSYLLGSFGSPQRLDYGSGHELSFLAFLACVWKLNGFPEKHEGVEERALVFGVIQPYLELVRRLILSYTLEPAGSHGVWGLDDHSFIPYIFGSAQFSPPISRPEDIRLEGSIEGAPDPADIVKLGVIDKERGKNLYFSAVGFIYDVKTGPFWEHSPILYDISGVKKGWAKINKGMIKMYHAEVLAKLPVVQHFPFGSMFRWEEDPSAPVQPASAHTATQPTGATTSGITTSVGRASSRVPHGSTQAPWIAATIRPDVPHTTTETPWSTPQTSGSNPSTISRLQEARAARANAGTKLPPELAPRAKPPKGDRTPSE